MEFRVWSSSSISEARTPFGKLQRENTSGHTQYIPNSYKTYYTDMVYGYYYSCRCKYIFQIVLLIIKKFFGLSFLLDQFSQYYFFNCEE